MYDFSGRWMTEVQLPAKSGVGGLIFVVIPRVMGLAIYSPRLDPHGNSVRGVEFCKRLVAAHRIGVFDRLVGMNSLKPLTRPASAHKTAWLLFLKHLRTVGRRYRLVRRLGGWPCNRYELESLQAAVSPARDALMEALKTALGVVLVSTAAATAPPLEKVHHGFEMLRKIRAYSAVAGQQVLTLSKETLVEVLRPTGGWMPVEELEKSFRRYSLSIDGDSHMQRWLRHLVTGSSVGMTRLRDCLQNFDRKGDCPARAYFTAKLVIPDPHSFEQTCAYLARQAMSEVHGEVFRELPIEEVVLADPDTFGVCIVTVHGQVFKFGSALQEFPLMGTVRPLLHALACSDAGADVSAWCGAEPTAADPTSFAVMPAETSGAEGDRSVNPKPWNPYMESGALVMCSLIGKAHAPVAERMFHDNGTRFSHMLNHFSAWAGGSKVGFSNSVFLAQKEKRLKTQAVSYFLKGLKALPDLADPVDVARMMFQAEAIEMNCEQLANVAAMFANAGVAPLTNQSCLQPKHVRRVLTAMYSCGLGLFSGKAMFTIGVPCAGGASGATIALVPGLFGMCIYSPRLNEMNVSPRAIRFCEDLCQHFGYSIFQRPPASLADATIRRRASSTSSKAFDVLHDRVLVEQKKLTSRRLYDMCSAASRGDVRGLRKLIMEGSDVNEMDYDNRTPLHVACSERQVEAAKLLLASGADVTLMDRWGHTPVDDAKSSHSPELIELLGWAAPSISLSASLTPKKQRIPTPRLDSTISLAEVAGLSAATSTAMRPVIRRALSSLGDFGEVSGSMPTPLHMPAPHMSPSADFDNLSPLK
jgi:glutaminase